MRKIILNIAVSLDGFIEGTDGENDWCFTDQDYGMAAFYAATDAIFMGRKAFDMIADPNAFEGKELYVFSDTLSGDLPAHIEVIRSGNFLKRVEEICHLPGENIWLFGGAGLISAFVNNNLINEYLLSIHPTVLGGGRPLFEDIKKRLDLMLVAYEIFPSGLAQLSYVKKPKFDLSKLSELG